MIRPTCKNEKIEYHDDHDQLDPDLTPGPIVPLPECLVLRRLPKSMLRGKSKFKLPDDYQGAPNFGAVVKTGDKAGEFKAGDRIFYDSIHGREITLPEYGTYVVIHKDDVVARYQP